MKLELKHLAPYLPYGLKMLVEKTHIAETDLLQTISHSPDEMLTLEDHGDFYFSPEFNEFTVKPILRNLPDLTKEIEHNGERFVPMLKLLGVCQGEHSFKFINEEIEYYSSGTSHVIKYLFTNPDMEIFREVYTLTYSEYLKSFSSFRKSTSERNHVDYQLLLFQKLFEWKFDCFNLIPAGLGIDKNTLAYKET